MPPMLDKNLHATYDNWTNKESKFMCFNCGCERPTDNMGSTDNITTETFEKAAKASDQTVEEAMRETLNLIEKELMTVEEDIDEA